MWGSTERQSFTFISVYALILVWTQELLLMQYVAIVIYLMLKLSLFGQLNPLKLALVSFDMSYYS